MKFYKWYSQALGSVIGMVSCIYGYLNGDLLLYSALGGNYDTLNFNQILSSYILYPLCILTFLSAMFIPVIKDYKDKKVLGMRVRKINTVLKYSAAIVGLLGCLIYFIPAALVILFSDILSLIQYTFNKLSNKLRKNPLNEQTSKKEATKEACDENSDEAELNPLLTNKPPNNNECLSTKREMAINLIDKNSNMDFIREITGLSPQYLTKLKKEKENLHSKKNSTIK